LDSTVAVAVPKKGFSLDNVAPKDFTFVLNLDAKVSTVCSSMGRNDGSQNPLLTEIGPMFMLSSASCWKYLRAWLFFVQRANQLDLQTQLQWTRFVRDHVVHQFFNLIY
jgi:hypothetical protein